MNEIETKLLESYNSLKPELNKWGSFVDKTLIEKLRFPFIENNLLKIFPKNRIKDDKSFLYKALYRKKNYKDPMLEIEDKVATRLVFLKSDDLVKVKDLIINSPEWESKITKSIRDEINENPNFFDYQSIHIVVWPTEEYDTSVERNILTCEIQIRTLLQHAFAEISHDSAYKGPYKNDTEILRHLAKSMALMEATDDYFCRIFDLMADEKRKYRIYLNELIRLYKNFKKDFTKESLNYEICDSIFSLLTLKEIQINDLEAFIEKRKDEIDNSIDNNNILIFEQPIILLVIYYLFNHQRFLKDNWPFSVVSLEQIFHIFNFSFENY